MKLFTRMRIVTGAVAVLGIVGVTSFGFTTTAFAQEGTTPQSSTLTPIGLNSATDGTTNEDGGKCYAPEPGGDCSCNHGNNGNGNGDNDGDNSNGNGCGCSFSNSNSNSNGDNDADNGNGCGKGDSDADNGNGNGNGATVSGGSTGSSGGQNGPSSDPASGGSFAAPTGSAGGPIDVPTGVSFSTASGAGGTAVADPASGPSTKLVSVSTAPAGSLPFTGADITRLVGVGAGAMAIGGIFVLSGRRRRSRTA